MSKEKDKPTAYIAGALNDEACFYIQNLHKMIIWGEKIRQLGFAVFIPGLDFLQGLVHGNFIYSDYFDNDQPFLKKCDIVFVVPGWENSKGTAEELRTARECSIPIYYEKEGLKQLKETIRNKCIHDWHIVDYMPHGSCAPIYECRKCGITK